MIRQNGVAVRIYKIPIIFAWDSIGNGVQGIMRLTGPSGSGLGIAQGIQWKTMEASSSGAATSGSSKRCHSGRRLCHGLRFHRLS